MARGIKHNLFCECPKCEPRFPAYVKKIAKEKANGKAQTVTARRRS